MPMKTFAPLPMHRLVVALSSNRQASFHFDLVSVLCDLEHASNDHAQRRMPNTYRIERFYSPLTSQFRNKPGEVVNYVRRLPKVPHMMTRDSKYLVVPALCCLYLARRPVNLLGTISSPGCLASANARKSTISPRPYSHGSLMTCSVAFRLGRTPPASATVGPPAILRSSLDRTQQIKTTCKFLFTMFDEK